MPLDPHMELLIRSLSQLHPVSDAATAFLEKNSFTREIGKGKLLVKAGAPCDAVYFVLSGALRGYVKEGNREITTWITVEGEMVSSIAAIDGNTHALENIQALENALLLGLSYSDLEKLYELHPEININVRKLLQKYYHDAEKRALIARIRKAETRYQLFNQMYGHLANRISLKIIASFLGLTEETLSRTRTKMKNA